MSTDVQIILSLLTLIGVVGGAIIAGVYSVKKANVEARATPYEVLADQVTELHRREAERDARDAEREEREAARDRREAIRDRRIEQLRRELSRTREASEKDRAYIRKAVVWIASHREMAKWPPPDEPDWIIE